MSALDDFDWSAPALSASDQRLVDAYLRVGKPVDELAYTEEFEKLFSSLAESDTQEARHAVYKRLLNLRKMGRLPRNTILPQAPATRRETEPA